MFRVFLCLAVPIIIACAYYLLMNPMERDNSNLTRFVGKKLFPQLSRDQRQKRLAFIAGLFLFTLLTAGFIAFLVKRLNMR